MPKTDTFENDVAKLFFNNTTIANIGDGTGVQASGTAGSLWFALYTASPGDAGTATTNEAAYANYTRIAVARSGAGFVVTAASVSPAANVDFPQAGFGANETETYFGIVNTSSGAGKLLYYGPIGSGPKYGTSLATSDVTTCYAHGFSAGDRVIFEAVEGTNVPNGLTEGTVYFVIATGLTTDAFEVSLTLGGAAVDITANGGALIYRVVPIVVTENVTPRLTTATTVQEG